MPADTIFISYSREDRAFVDQLTADLRAAGFSIWRDTESLTPGTVNWENAIRAALADAAAVVLVASPAARQSPYVIGELTVAKLHNCPVYPIWAAGDTWINCVPLDMANYQYADARGDGYATGSHQLTETLRSVLDTSEGTVTLGLPTHETVEVNLAQFSNAFEVLTFIYLNYLSTWYHPLTYGIDWVLGNVHSKQLALTWDWLLLDRTNEEGLMRSIVAAQSVNYQMLGIADNSYWAVWDATRVHRVGVALNDVSLRSRILQKGGESVLHQLHDDNTLNIADPGDVNPGEYATSFLMAVFQTSRNNIAYVQQP